MKWLWRIQIISEIALMISGLVAFWNGDYARASALWVLAYAPAIADIRRHVWGKKPWTG